MKHLYETEQDSRGYSGAATTLGYVHTIGICILKLVIFLVLLILAKTPFETRVFAVLILIYLNTEKTSAGVGLIGYEQFLLVREKFLGVLKINNSELVDAETADLKLFKEDTEEEMKLLMIEGFFFITGTLVAVSFLVVSFFK